MKSIVPIRGRSVHYASWTGSTNQVPGIEKGSEVWRGETMAYMGRDGRDRRGCCHGPKLHWLFWLRPSTEWGRMRQASPFLALWRKDGRPMEEKNNLHFVH